MLYMTPSRERIKTFLEKMFKDIKFSKMQKELLTCILYSERINMTEFLKYCSVYVKKKLKRTTISSHFTYIFKKIYEKRQVVIKNNAELVRYLMPHLIYFIEAERNVIKAKSINISHDLRENL